MEQRAFKEKFKIMNIVIDTNCLLQIFSKKSPYYSFYLELLAGKVCLLLSSDVLLEYEEVIAYKVSPNFSFYLTTSFLKNRKFKKVEIFFYWHLINNDPDDNKFVDLAINGNADYLITDDKHFNVLKNITFPKLKIVSMSEFFELWNKTNT